MVDTKTDKDEILFPSDVIGVEEEFLPAKNSTFVEDHKIKAAIPGKLFIDTKYYRAKVFPLNKASSVPTRYDIVIGQVIKVSKSSLRISIGYLNNKPVNPTRSAIMHISDAASEYINDLDDSYKAGDIIRAKIIDAKTVPLQLACKDSNTGVIYANCDKCGSELTKLKRNLLECSACGKKQSRITAIDYGSFTFIPEY